MDLKNLWLMVKMKIVGQRTEGAILFIRRALILIFIGSLSSEELLDKEEVIDVQFENVQQYLKKYSTEISNIYNKS